MLVQVPQSFFKVILTGIQCNNKTKIERTRWLRKWLVDHVNRTINNCEITHYAF